jgi:hypothetical protein
MRFLQSVPFRGLRHTASVPESREYHNGLIARMAKKRGKSVTRNVVQPQHKQRAQRNVKPASRRRDRYITAHHSASQRFDMGGAQPVNPSPHPTVRGKHGGTKFENNSKNIQESRLGKGESR